MRCLAGGDTRRMLMCDGRGSCVDTDMDTDMDTDTDTDHIKKLQDRNVSYKT